MYMLMHVALLFCYKSSFSYLPPPRLAQPSPPHTLFLLISCSSTCCKALRETVTPDLREARKQLLLCLFQGKMLWETFLGVLSEVLQFLLPLGKPFCEQLSESPSDVALQLAEHISLSPKNTFVCLTTAPDHVKRDLRVSVA